MNKMAINTTINTHTHCFKNINIFFCAFFQKNALSDVSDDVSYAFSPIYDVFSSFLLYIFSFLFLDFFWRGRSQKNQARMNLIFLSALTPYYTLSLLSNSWLTLQSLVFSFCHTLLGKQSFSSLRTAVWPVPLSTYLVSCIVLLIIPRFLLPFSDCQTTQYMDFPPF